METVSLVNLDDKKNMWLTPNACSLRFSQVGFKWLQVVNNCCCRFCCVWLLATPWTITCQAPPSMGLSSQEYQSGWPCLPPGDLLNSEIQPMSHLCPSLAGRCFTISVTWEALVKQGSLSARVSLKLCVICKKQSLASLFVDCWHPLTHTETISARGKDWDIEREHKNNVLFNYS